MLFFCSVCFFFFFFYIRECSGLLMAVICVLHIQHDVDGGLPSMDAGYTKGHSFEKEILGC